MIKRHALGSFGVDVVYVDPAKFLVGHASLLRECRNARFAFHASGLNDRSAWVMLRNGWGKIVVWQALFTRCSWLSPGLCFPLVPPIWTLFLLAAWSLPSVTPVTEKKFQLLLPFLLASSFCSHLDLQAPLWALALLESYLNPTLSAWVPPSTA